MKRPARLALTPAPYGAWAVLVAAALVAAYFIDPYVFGFTTLGLAALTAIVAGIGATVCVRSPEVLPRSRVLILLWLAAAAAAIASALDALGRIRWA